MTVPHSADEQIRVQTEGRVGYDIDDADPGSYQ
jgi:hypothetical protein